jgi:hypothetical protein
MVGKIRSGVPNLQGPRSTDQFSCCGPLPSFITLLALIPLIRDAFMTRQFVELFE